MLDLAFGWLLSRPVVSSVIAGATRPEQVVTECRGRRVEPEEVLRAVDEIAPREPSA